MLEFNTDMFYLLVSITMKLKRKDVPQIIEDIYQRLFIKNEDFVINDHWFPFLDIYVKHRDILILNKSCND